MRLPKTFDGEMPESMTATPTPVPLGPLVVLRVAFEVTPRAVRSVAPDGATVTCTPVTASLEIDRMLGLCASPSSAALGISRVAASMSACSDLTLKPPAFRPLTVAPRVPGTMRTMTRCLSGPFPRSCQSWTAVSKVADFGPFPFPGVAAAGAEIAKISPSTANRTTGRHSLTMPVLDSRVAANSRRAANSLISRRLQLRAGNYRIVCVFRTEHADQPQIGVTAGGLEC